MAIAPEKREMESGNPAMARPIPPKKQASAIQDLSFFSLLFFQLRSSPGE